MPPDQPPYIMGPDCAARCHADEATDSRMIIAERKEQRPLMSAGTPNRRPFGCDQNGVPLVGQIDERHRFHIGFQAQDFDIDELGHVNNAVWVIWIQEASMAHWLMAARPEDRDRFVAVVLRHEVDYRGNVREGDEISAVTWISGTPRGARYVRRTEFHDSNGRAIVTALTHWAMVDRETGKLVRVRAEMAAPFVCNDEQFKETK